jgi:hypothetical protein
VAIANGRLKRILHGYAVENSERAILLVYPRRRFLNQRLRASVDNAITLAEEVQQSISQAKLQTANDVPWGDLPVARLGKSLPSFGGKSSNAGIQC